VKRAAVRSLHKTAARQEKPASVPDVTDTTGATTVLVIESDSELANLLKALLERAADNERFRVLIAEDVTRGLQLVTDPEIECVVLDLDSPAGPGDPLGRLRAIDRTTPVIVLSGHTDYETQSRLAARQGADSYLVKGYIDRTTLTQAIHDAIQAGLSSWRRPLPSSSDPESDTIGSETLRVASETIFALVRRLGIPLIALTVNDRYGGVDDGRMRALGDLLATSVRRSDLVARTKRDEYCVLLAGAHEASEALDRVRAALRTEQTIEGADASIIFGLAVLDPERPQSLMSLLRAARRNIRAR
jgi:CheY-like chemotaxis protein